MINSFASSHFSRAHRDRTLVRCPFRCYERRVDKRLVRHGTAQDSARNLAVR
jgi:hypothetical protein